MTRTAIRLGTTTASFFGNSVWMIPGVGAEPMMEETVNHDHDNVESDPPMKEDANEPQEQEQQYQAQDHHHNHPEHQKQQQHHHEQQEQYHPETHHNIQQEQQHQHHHDQFQQQQEPEHERQEDQKYHPDEEPQREEEERLSREERATENIDNVQSPERNEQDVVTSHQHQPEEEEEYSHSHANLEEEPIPEYNHAHREEEPQQQQSSHHQHEPETQQEHYHSTETGETQDTHQDPPPEEIIAEAVLADEDGDPPPYPNLDVDHQDDDANTQEEAANRRHHDPPPEEIEQAFLPDEEDPPYDPNLEDAVDHHHASRHHHHDASPEEIQQVYLPDEEDPPYDPNLEDDVDHHHDDEEEWEENSHPNNADEQESIPPKPEQQQEGTIHNNDSHEEERSEERHVPAESVVHTTDHQKQEQQQHSEGSLYHPPAEDNLSHQGEPHTTVSAADKHEDGVMEEPSKVSKPTQEQPKDGTNQNNKNDWADIIYPTSFHPHAYGWPVRSPRDDVISSSVQADRYRQFMAGCSPRNACIRHEADRLAMNRAQPPQMQQNFTFAGYAAKLALPPSTQILFESLWKTYLQYQQEQQDYDDDDDKNERPPIPTSACRPRVEQWQPGSAYTNHWEVPTEILNVHHCWTLPQLRHVESELKQVLEQWSGVALVPTSTYGMRIYHTNSILTPHVDRLPLVISAIVHVGQESLLMEEENDDDSQTTKEADEDWPLQLISHSGTVVNVTLQPGEMLLYESHSIIHGRPYPLQQKSYANVFFHFEPIGYTHAHSQAMMEAEQQKQREQQAESSSITSLATKFQKLLQYYTTSSSSSKAETAKTVSSSSSSTTSEDEDFRLPPYLWKRKQKQNTATTAANYPTRSPNQQLLLEQQRWKQEYHFIRDTPPKEIKPQQNQKTPGATSAHSLAASGQLHLFKELVRGNPELLDQSDANGWKPIHEAARGGHTKVLQFLIAQGVDVNERTNNGQGASPLWWTLQYFDESHPAAQLLKRHGAVALPPRG